MIDSSFPAMGTKVRIRADDSTNAPATLQLFEDVEQTASRFRLDSELSRINEDPAPTVHLSPLLSELLESADRARSLTGGLVDAAAGSAVAVWGYDASYEEVQDLAAEPEPTEAGHWTIAGNLLTRSPGTILDLGGIAKGWTCDRAVEDGLVTVAGAGGDLRSADPDTVVEIIDPWGEVASVVHLGVGALATSSSTRRAWTVGAHRAHHIIDPRTGAPSVSPVLSATALTATAVEAEAAAKATLLLGAEGLAWADRQPWIRATIVVWRDGAVYATGLEDAA